jgi:hypothetical protein
LISLEILVQLKSLDVNAHLARSPLAQAVNKQLGAALGVNSPRHLSESYSPTHSRLKAETHTLKAQVSKSRQDQEALLAEKTRLEQQMGRLKEEEERAASERQQEQRERQQEHDVHRQKMKSKRQRAEMRRQTHEIALKASRMRVAELEETETFQSELLEQQTHELNTAKREVEDLKKQVRLGTVAVLVLVLLRC